MGDRPIGLTVVAILMLLGAVGDFFFALILAVLSSIGGPPPSGYRPSPLLLILIYSPLLFSLVSFVASVGILAGVKHAWRLSIILWIFSAAYHGFIAAFWFRGMNLLFMVAIIGMAMLANTAFIIYFQTERVKSYFRRSRER